MMSGDKDYSVARCHAKLLRTDLVSGEKVYQFCSIERDKPWVQDDRCGPDALNFEPIQQLTH